MLALVPPLPEKVKIPDTEDRRAVMLPLRAALVRSRAYNCPHCNTTSVPENGQCPDCEKEVK